MRQLIIITPFSRPRNIPALLDMWKEAFGVIGFETRWLLMSAATKSGLSLPWVWEADCVPPQQGFDPCYFKSNEAISRLENVGLLNEHHVIGFLPDDDTYDPGLVSCVLDAAESAEVVVASSRRHHGGQHTDTLIAAPENMKVCSVGLEQFFVRGDVLRQVPRFENISHADGLMIERLWAKNKDGFRFLPETFVNFNILPP